MTEDHIQAEVSLKRGIPRWLIIVGIILAAVCVCGTVIAIVTSLTLFSPAINAARLPAVCVQNNPDMDPQACEAWARDVKNTAEYEDCFLQDASTGYPDVNNLYACLVENGVGPD